MNDLLRLGLVAVEAKPRGREFRIRPTRIGFNPDLNYDCTEALLEHLEGIYYR